jgi:L-arabinose isomerase
MTRPRVTLLQPYWDFWETSVAYDLRADRGALEETVRALLDVEWVGPEAAEAILILQTMATPPTPTLDQLGSLPVVIWAAHRPGSIGAAFDHGSITSEGATVGAPMLTSVLVRAGRPFELILGRIDDRDARRRVEQALSAAAASRRLRRARIGRVGRPLPGYACVDTDDALLGRLLGIDVVPIEPREVTELYQAVSAERVRDLEAEVRAGYVVETDGDELNRTLRAALAIDDLVGRHELDAGAMNCHVPEIRFGEEIGITPCFGLGRSTTRGVPWTCVGDVLTAVAMLAGKLLGAAAQYHELEAVDYATGEFVIASSGEFDLGFGDGASPRLVRNGWFASDARCGACACFAGPAGPATLIGFAQVGESYRLIAADGELTGRSFPATGTANGGFRFAHGLDGWTAWCRAGANHHSSATPGAFGPAVEALGRFAGIEAVRV